jgi:hypothetical protein
LVISFLILFLVLAINGAYFKKCHTDSQKAITAKILQDDFKYKTIPLNKIKSINVADSLFNFKKADIESNQEFLKRYTKFLNTKFPNNLEIEKQNKLSK